MNEQRPTVEVYEDDKDKTPAVAADGLWTHLRVSVVATLVLAVVVCGIYPLVVWGLSQVIFHDKANGSLITDKDGKVIGSKLIGQAFSDAKYFHGRPSAAGSGYDATASGGSNLGPTSAKLLNGTTKPAPPPTPDATPAATPAAASPEGPATGPATSQATASTATPAVTQPTTAPVTPPTTQPAVIVDNDGIKLRVLHYCDDNSIPFEASQDGKVIDLKPYKTEKGDWDEVKLILAFGDADHPLTVKASKPIPADAVTASASGLDPHISVENALIQVARVADARKVSPDVVKKLVEKFTEGPDLGILGDAGVNVLLLNIELDRAAPAPAPAAAPTTPVTATAPATAPGK